MRVDLVQGSDSWLSWRQGKISASMMPIIMGVNPWKSRHKLWQQVLGIIPEDYTNHHMQRGTTLEPFVRKMVEDKLATRFLPACYSHDLDTWAIASLDGISDCGDTIIEIKCPARKDTKIPDMYLPQIHWQLYCSSAKKCFYCSFTDGELEIFVVYRDDAYIESLRKEALLFLQSIRNLEEPEPALSELEELNDIDDIETAFDYEIADNQAKHWAKKRDELRDKLIEKANGRNVRIQNFMISKYTMPGRIDYDKIPVLNGVDKEFYRKPPTVSWRISRKSA